MKKLKRKFKRSFETKGKFSDGERSIKKLTIGKSIQQNLVEWIVKGKVNIVL